MSIKHFATTTHTLALYPPLSPSTTHSYTPTHTLCFRTLIRPRKNLV